MIILALYSIIHVLEAWLEVKVIALKCGSQMNYEQLNHEEHFRSAVLAIAYFACFLWAAILLQQFYIIPALVFNRRVFFDYSLIIFRDRPRHKYEGNDWWVKRFIWIFGKNGRIKELAFELLITAASAIMQILHTKSFY